mgnify:FL=1|tara:strand:+ start:1725 stop:2543 length:819 start_codon:yes stop_codon:yes gene_type:complete
MSKKVHFTLFLFFISHFNYSQGWLPMGSRSQSLANASVCLADVWSYHHNPAATANVESFGVGLSYENRFLLKELQSQGFVLVAPLKNGALSGGAQSYGFNNYRTYRVGMGYSLNLTEVLTAGVQLNYHMIRLTQQYGNHQTVTAELGLMAKVTDDWDFGFSVFNLGRNKLSEFMDDRYTTMLRFGTSYQVSRIVLLVAELEKNIDYPLRSKFGVEYSPAKQFFVRGGFATAPIELSFGMGYRFADALLFDFGAAYHQQLGWCPNVSFSYLFK